MIFNEVSLAEEDLPVKEQARKYVGPIVTEQVSYSLLGIFSIIIRVTDCNPDLDQCDMAKHYKTYVKAKFLFFVWDSYIKSKYKPILNSRFEFDWFNNIRAALRMLLLNLERRFNRRKYDNSKK